jgi:signal peptidase I
MKRRFSYSDQKSSRHRFRGVILVVIIFFLVYTLFTSLIFSVRVLENNTMAPNIRRGERIIFTSFNIYSLLPGFEIGKGTLPFKRGEVVLVDMFRTEKPGVTIVMLDSAVRFLSAQKLTIINQKDHVYLKRVIGLPGDEITMTNYVIRVKTRGSSYSLTEFEVSEQDYTPDIPQAPALWDSSLPFSGNMERIILGENECFILSDDRSNTNDSRTWGPIQLKNISGKALIRYWPLSRFGPL